MIRYRRPATSGATAASAADNIERVSDELMRKPAVVTYSLESGSNSIRHGQPATPSGHIVVYAEMAIQDDSIDKTHWNVTAAAGGTVKLIWIV